MDDSNTTHRSIEQPHGRDGIASRLRTAFALTALLLLAPGAWAIPVQYDLTFSTSGQSLWGSGESFTFQHTSFLGAQWQDKRAGVDLITGDADTSLINPLREAYDLAFAGCRALGFSSSVCINGQSARAPVPALGSRPSVRSCGKFAVGCKLARAGDLGKRAAYDLAFSACRKLGFSSSVCRNGQSARVPVPALGTAPPQFLNIDTRTGVAFDATSDGRVGLELGFAADSGSVDATVEYDAILELPDTVGLDKSNPLNLNPSSLLAGGSSLETTFPTLALSLDAIMELSGSVGGEACLIPSGCAGGATPFDIDERAPIFSVNQDGEGGVLLLGQSPTDLGVTNPNADGFPFSFDVLNGLASGTLFLPQPNASGGLDGSGEKLFAEGHDDLFDLFLDVDNVITTAAGAPGLLGSSFDIELGSLNLGSVGYDIIDVQMGPTVDLKQEFELDPTLFVSLVFDQAVEIAGEVVTTLVSAWDLLPDITFLSDVTTVTPTFFVQADLMNRTLLDFDLEFLIDLLQVSYDFGILGDGSFGIGNVLAQGVDLFESPALFSSLFALGGFNLQLGESFVVDFLSGTTAPIVLDARSADNEIVLAANPSAVAAPGAGALLLLGLGALHALRRRASGAGRGAWGAWPAAARGA